MEEVYRGRLRATQESVWTVCRRKKHLLPLHGLESGSLVITPPELLRLPVSVGILRSVNIIFFPENMQNGHVGAHGV